MRLLLDTHVFLWWIADDPRVSLPASKAIAMSENEVFLSVASAWEIVVKTRLGKLALPADVESFLPDQIQRNAISISFSRRQRTDFCRPERPAHGRYRCYDPLSRICGK